MAALFDALMFLTAISTICISLLALSLGERSPADRNVQEFVESVNIIFSRTMIDVPSRMENGESEKQSPCLEISSLISGLIRNCSESRIELPDWARGQMLSILDGFLEPVYDYRWMAVSAQGEIVIGLDVPDTLEQLYVSTIEISGTTGQAAFAMVLTCWFRELPGVNA